MNRGMCTVQWNKVPEEYFTQHLDYWAMLILLFVYISFALQIFVCCLSHFQHLITALGNSQITMNSSVLSNCKCRQIIITYMVLLLLYCTLFCTWPSEYTFVNYNIVPYSYLPHILSLHILCIQLQIFKYIVCIYNVHLKTLFLPWTVHSVHSEEGSCLTNALYF